MTDEEEVPNYIIDYKNYLGKGAFALVFKAVHKETGSLVAIKKIDLKQQGVSDHYLEQEIQNIKKIKHPNVLKLIDHRRSPHYFYMVFELCTEDLGAYLKRNSGSISEKEAISILKQVACALHEVWSLNIIHRDLKPQNILLLNGRVKLADFGLSKSLNPDEGSVKMTYAGTPLFMAPEVKTGKYNVSCDVYSLGVTFISMMYPIKSPEEIAVFKPPEEWRSETKDFILKSICFKPEDRIPHLKVKYHPIFGLSTKEVRTKYEIPCKKALKLGCDLHNETSALHKCQKFTEPLKFEAKALFMLVAKVFEPDNKPKCLSNLDDSVLEDINYEAMKRFSDVKSSSEKIPIRKPKVIVLAEAQQLIKDAQMLAKGHKYQEAFDIYDDALGLLSFLDLIIDLKFVDGSPDDYLKDKNTCENAISTIVTLMNCKLISITFPQQNKK